MSASAHNSPIASSRVLHATSAPLTRFASIVSPSANRAVNAFAPILRTRAAYRLEPNLTSALFGICFWFERAPPKKKAGKNPFVYMKYSLPNSGSDP